jgi:hypothetical protein
MSVNAPLASEEDFERVTKDLDSVLNEIKADLS